MALESHQPAGCRHDIVIARQHQESRACQRRIGIHANHALEGSPAEAGFGDRSDHAFADTGAQTVTALTPAGAYAQLNLRVLR